MSNFADLTLSNKMKYRFLLYLFIYLFISFFFNLGDPFDALALFFLGVLHHDYSGLQYRT